jgi:ubiquitin C-terminal hydrolase
MLRDKHRNVQQQKKHTPPSTPTPPSSSQGDAGNFRKKKKKTTQTLPPIPNKEVMSYTKEYLPLLSSNNSNKYTSALSSLSSSSPVGIINCGNSCYANACFQALLSTLPFVEYFSKGLHSKKGCLCPNSGKDWCLMCELEQLIEALNVIEDQTPNDDDEEGDEEGGSFSSFYRNNNDTQHEINLRPLLVHLRKLGGRMTYGRQEDAHELLIKCLEIMSEIELACSGGKNKYRDENEEEEEEEENDDDVTGNDNNENKGSKEISASSGRGGGGNYALNTTLVHNIFGGYLASQVQCLNCGTVSESYQNELTLALTVPSVPFSMRASSPNLTDLIRAEYGTQEKLHGRNAYKCEVCEKKVTAMRSVRIKTAPNYLAVQLKRFSAHGGGRYGKITSRVLFGEVLDMKEFMADEDEDDGGGGDDASTSTTPPPSTTSTATTTTPRIILDPGPSYKYTLYAVVVHLDWGGSTICGHYIAYVRRGKTWYKCDDEVVQRVHVSQVLATAPYLLFYERNTPRQAPVVVVDTKEGGEKIVEEINNKVEVSCRANGVAHHNHDDKGIDARQYGIRPCIVDEDKTDGIQNEEEKEAEEAKALIVIPPPPPAAAAATGGGAVLQSPRIRLRRRVASDGEEVMRFSIECPRRVKVKKNGEGRGEEEEGEKGEEEECDVSDVEKMIRVMVIEGEKEDLVGGEGDGDGNGNGNGAVMGQRLVVRPEGRGVLPLNKEIAVTLPERVEKTAVGGGKWTKTEEKWRYQVEYKIK